MKVKKVCTNCLWDALGKERFGDDQLSNSGTNGTRSCDACGKHGEGCNEIPKREVWNIHFDWELHQLVEL